jgi:hypothetical protein
MGAKLQAAWALVCLGVHIAGASATLVEGSISGQVQVFTDKGELTGCGLTLVAIEVPKTPGGVLTVFNGSFSLQDPRGGLVKGRAAQLSGRALASGKAVPSDIKPLETEFVWLKAPGAAATFPVNSNAIGRSDDPGYQIYVASLTSLMAVTEAVTDGQPIQVGMRVRGRGTDNALYGKVELSEQDMAQFQQCVGEWSSNVLKRYRDAPVGDGSQR